MLWQQRSSASRCAGSTQHVSQRCCTVGGHGGYRCSVTASSAAALVATIVSVKREAWVGLQVRKAPGVGFRKV